MRIVQNVLPIRVSTYCCCTWYTVRCMYQVPVYDSRSYYCVNIRSFAGEGAQGYLATTSSWCNGTALIYFETFIRCRLKQGGKLSPPSIRSRCRYTSIAAFHSVIATISILMATYLASVSAAKSAM